LIFVCLYRLFPSLIDASIVYRPETLLRWRRHGFRLFRRWKSRRRVGRPVLSADIQSLVRRISRENPLWGAPRIHGELLKLGIEIAQSTVAKYMVRRRGLPSQGWKTFIRDHAPDIAAIDLRSPGGDRRRPGVSAPACPRAPGPPGAVALFAARRCRARATYAVLSASAKAGQADPSTALSAGATASVFASLSTLDAIVVRVVGKALLGDMRAISWICDVIEGRPERCRGDVRASPRRLLSSAHAKNLRPGGWLTDFMSAFLVGITLASADTAKFQIASGRGKAGL